MRSSFCCGRKSQVGGRSNPSPLTQKGEEQVSVHDYRHNKIRCSYHDMMTLYSFYVYELFDSSGDTPREVAREERDVRTKVRCTCIGLRSQVNMLPRALHP